MIEKVLIEEKEVTIANFGYGTVVFAGAHVPGLKTHALFLTTATEPHKVGDVVEGYKPGMKAMDMNPQIILNFHSEKSLDVLIKGLQIVKQKFKAYKKKRTKSLSQYIDEQIGVIGTPERDQFEAELLK